MIVVTYFHNVIIKAQNKLKKYIHILGTNCQLASLTFFSIMTQYEIKF